MTEFMMSTIRPTMDMVRNIFGGLASETWIFGDCAIAKMRNGSFCALIVRRFADGPFKGETYYGFIRNMLPLNPRICEALMDRSSERFEKCPQVFNRPVRWEHVTEGNRYVYP